MAYEWKWKRANGKHFLELLKDGKKIGHTQQIWLPCVCGAYPCQCFQFEAYKGGGKIGAFPAMTDAKIAVEQALGVSTTGTGAL